VLEVLECDGPAVASFRFLHASQQVMVIFSFSAQLQHIAIRKRAPGDTDIFPVCVTENLRHCSSATPSSTSRQRSHHMHDMWRALKQRDLLLSNQKLELFMQLHKV